MSKVVQLSKALKLVRSPCLLLIDGHCGTVPTRHPKEVHGKYIQTYIRQIKLCRLASRNSCTPGVAPRPGSRGVAKQERCGCGHVHPLAPEARRHQTCHFRRPRHCLLCWFPAWDIFPPPVLGYLSSSVALTLGPAHWDLAHAAKRQARSQANKLLSGKS